MGTPAQSSTHVGFVTLWGRLCTVESYDFAAALGDSLVYVRVLSAEEEGGRHFFLKLLCKIKLKSAETINGGRTKSSLLR